MDKIVSFQEPKDKKMPKVEVPLGMLFTYYYLPLP